jgi:hypothetical protein
MQRPDEDLLSGFAAWSQSLDDLLGRSSVPERRVGELAGLLRGEFPTAEVVACRLEGNESPWVAARASDRASEPRWAAQFARPLSDWVQPKDHIFSLRLLDADRPLRSVLAAAARGDRRWAVLVVGMTPDAADSELMAARSLLQMIGGLLAVRLELEEAMKHVAELREEFEELTGIVTVGEAMVSLLHGLNNSLNTMMLQAAVVQLKVDEPMRQEIGLIRKEGAQIAARMRPLMQFREQRRQNRTRVDLHPIIEEFVRTIVPAPALEVRLEATQSQVMAHATDLKRLLYYLMQVTAPSAGESADMRRLRTANHQGDVQLILEPGGNGAPMYVETGSSFDPYNETTKAEGMLERLALDSLLRLVGGTLRFYAHPDGKSTTVVVWPSNT